MTAERLTSTNWTVTILNLGGFSPSRLSHLCSFCSCWLATPHHYWSSCYTAQWCCPPNVRNITGLIKTHWITINYFSPIRITFVCLLCLFWRWGICLRFHFTVFFNNHYNFNQLLWPVWPWWEGGMALNVLNITERFIFKGRACDTRVWITGQFSN